MSFRPSDVYNFSDNIDAFTCLSIEQISRMERPTILCCVNFESADTVNNRINRNKQPHPLEGFTSLSRSWKISELEKFL